MMEMSTSALCHERCITAKEIIMIIDLKTGIKNEYGDYQAAANGIGCTVPELYDTIESGGVFDRRHNRVVNGTGLCRELNVRYAIGGLDPVRGCLVFRVGK